MTCLRAAHRQAGVSLTLAGSRSIHSPINCDGPRPQLSSREILARFDGERWRFLAGVLRHARKARTWFDIDTRQAATDLSVSRERIIAALDYLGEQDMLELKAAGVRYRYRILRRPDDPDALAARLHRRTLKREASEIARLQQVTDQVEHDGCQVAALSAHFGEDREPCGHCSWCLNNRTPAELPKSQPPPIDENVWREALKVGRQHPETLQDPRAMARFLCGVSTPWLSRARIPARRTRINDPPRCLSAPGRVGCAGSQRRT